MSALYIISIVIAWIAFVIAAIAITIAVSDSFRTVDYNLVQQVRTGHTLSIFAAVLSWIAVFVLGILLLVTSFTNLNPAPSLTDELLSKNASDFDPTKTEDLEDIKSLHSESEDLDKAKSSGVKTIVIIGFVIVLLHSIVITILSIIAFVLLNSVKNPDLFLRNAKTALIIGAIFGGISLLAMIGTISFYIGNQNRIAQRHQSAIELKDDIAQYHQISAQGKHPKINPEQIITSQSQQTTPNN